jgi:hypothetical protein
LNSSVNRKKSFVQELLPLIFYYFKKNDVKSNTPDSRRDQQPKVA